MVKNIQIQLPDGRLEKVYYIYDDTPHEIYWEDNYLKVVTGKLTELWSYSYLIRVASFTEDQPFKGKHKERIQK